MKIRTLEILVGVFMILGIIALLILALQVSGLGDIRGNNNVYMVNAEFANIGGLKVRGKVSIAGVNIGRVTSIKLEPNSYNAKVTLAIYSNINNIPVDSRASILTSGLLGDNYIGITPGFEEDSFLKEGSDIVAENTDSAIVLEQLISKFVAGQASKEQ